MNCVWQNKNTDFGSLKIQCGGNALKVSHSKTILSFCCEHMTGGRKAMLTMAQIQYIKHLRDKKDKSIAKISALVCQVLPSSPVAAKLIVAMLLAIHK